MSDYEEELLNSVEYDDDYYAAQCHWALILH